MIVNPGNQTLVSVPVDPVATAVRGNSNPVRSDIPPVQADEGVRYTRGKPTEDDQPPLYAPRRRIPSEPDDTAGRSGQDSPGKDQDGQGASDQSDAADAREPDGAEADPEGATTLAAIDTVPPADAMLLQARQRGAHLHIDTVPAANPEPSDAVRLVPAKVLEASYLPAEPPSSPAVKLSI